MKFEILAAWAKRLYAMYVYTEINSPYDVKIGNQIDFVLFRINSQNNNN